MTAGSGGMDDSVMERCRRNDVRLGIGDGKAAIGAGSAGVVK